MINFWISSSQIKNDIFIPKYYDPHIKKTIDELKNTHHCISLRELSEMGVIVCSTGDEIGKSCYGTGDIPFVRTSDISNWEINSIPKQGVDKRIFNEYAEKQDVQPGDILFVRDGTYLIGNNCFITDIDKELLYQSHIVKIRVIKKDILEPELLFLILNSPLVKKQIRAFQFTADIIDTIGQRFYEIVIPIPKSKKTKIKLIKEAQKALNDRVKGKTFIKQCPKIIEDVLINNTSKAINEFLSLQLNEVLNILATDTLTSEFGDFEFSWISSKNIINNIYLPKYYDPSIKKELSFLEDTCYLITMKQLSEEGTIKYYTGDEIGKMAYGTGSIPFIRTSDFSNWEIKHDPKQGISEEIYQQYKDKQNVKENDILLVRDGTYLVGRSCIITKYDEKALFCGGLYKITVKTEGLLDPYLFLGLINSYIVKRQIRTKQFTRDVIDTIGNRIDEVVIPIPKDKAVRDIISKTIYSVIKSRIDAREKISILSKSIY